MMPTKTIYVRDEDLPVFDQAQELAQNNLSAAITWSLKRFVEHAEAAEKGFEEVTVRVGKGRNRQKKRFYGAPLARWQLEEENKLSLLTAFRTAKGKFVLYTRTIPDWANIEQRLTARMAWGMWGWEMTAKPGDWSTRRPSRHAWHHGPPLRPGRPNPWHPVWEIEARLDIYDSLEALQGHVPEEFFEEVKHALEGETAEFLDI
jgi:EXLDI family protein